MTKSKSKEKPEWVLLGEQAARVGVTHQSIARRVIEARVTVLSDRAIINWLRGVSRGPDIGQWRLIAPIVKVAIAEGKR